LGTSPKQNAGGGGP